MTNNGQFNILIVDDDPAHLKLYGWVLERGGFRAVPALADGGTLELPRAERIAVAVIDYRLGHLTAVEVAEQIKRAYSKAPLVVLSDEAWMPDDIAPFAAGFVRKGEPQQLLDMVGALVERRSQHD